MRAKTTQELLTKLNKARGFKHPDIGYQYWADIKGDGQDHFATWTICNPGGGVQRSVLNRPSAGARCEAIRSEIKAVTTRRRPGGLK